MSSDPTDCTGVDDMVGPMELLAAAGASTLGRVPTVGLALYSFGALLTTAGVGSVLYDFSGTAECCWEECCCGTGVE